MNEEVKRAAKEAAEKGGSGADIVYAALRANGAPLGVKELIDLAVCLKSGGDGEGTAAGTLDADKAKLAARIHTEINMDLRFVYAQKGMWGLREWVKPQPVKRVITATPRGSAGLDSWLKAITGDEEIERPEEDWAQE
ncbi:MAG TPA: hypothetical protein GXX40_04510 [Firmicutes bacterium]|nr:hypothetical protein [Bacillota bacterium]